MNPNHVNLSGRASATHAALNICEPVLPSALRVPCDSSPLTSTFASPNTQASDCPLALQSSRQPKVGSHHYRGGLRQPSWSEAEDALFLELIGHLGLKRWTRIAAVLNAELYDGNSVRKGKQCRERWQNHLNPELNSKAYTEGEWSYEEDIRLLQHQATLGNRWSQLAAMMPGRTENSVKNRYTSLIRKAKTAYNMELYPEESISYLLIQEFEAKAIEEQQH